MKNDRKRNNIGIEFTDQEKEDIRDKREAIKQSGLQYTHKYIYMYGLNKLFNEAKQR